LTVSEASTAPPVAPAAREARDRSWSERLAPYGVPIVTVVIVVVFSQLSDAFLRAENWQNILNDAALPIMVAVGLTLVLVLGEFDLSIQANAGLSTMLISVLTARNGMDTALALLLTLAIGTAIGLVNGLLVAYCGVNALIVTIGVASILNGLEFWVSDSQQIFSGFPRGLTDFARGSIGPVDTLVVLAVALAIVYWQLIERTTIGRNMRAVGSNPEAARIAGVDVRRTKLVGFMLTGFAASLAGTLFAARQGLALPLNGLQVLLPSFAACFIGAAAFKLGQFNVPGTVLGVLIAGITANGLLLMSVPAYASYIFQGAILLGALLFSRLVATRHA
jgi:ribose/xylose/arabinose/galactoside ABC-type transport system permease subunit